MPDGWLDSLAEENPRHEMAVESQFGEADHDHLTRPLAPAIGLECRAVTLVAAPHQGEFVADVRWDRHAHSCCHQNMPMLIRSPIAHPSRGESRIS